MPSRLHAKSVAHYVDEFDFSGVSNSAELVFTNPPGDVTAFADTDMTYVEGKPGFTFTVNGLFSTASPNYDLEMFTDLTSEGRRVGIYPSGAVVGVYGYEGDTNVSEQARTAEIAGAILLNVTWQGDTPVVRTVLLGVDTAAAASGDGAKHNVGAAASTDTIVGVLRLLAVPGGSGNNTLDIKIESDADNSAGGETTRLTFTQLNQDSVALHEIKEAVISSSDAWWRVVLTYAGAGSRTFNIVIAFGIRPT